MSPTLGRAALWRAARSGLEGELVDVHGPASRPAAEVVTELVRLLRPQLEDTGDWDIVSELARQVLIAGTSAARQRRALRRRGRLTDVVDQLIAETAGRWPNAAAAVGDDPTLLFGYQPGSDDDPRTRARTATTKRSIRRSPAAALRGSSTPSPIWVWPRCAPEKAASNRSSAPTTSRSGSAARAAPSCSRSTWSRAWSGPTNGRPDGGLGQRARALDAFLRDIYSEQAIIADGVIEVQALDRAPGFRSTGRLARRHGARTHQRHRSGVRPGRSLDGARGQSAGPVRHRVRDRQPATARQAPARAEPPAGPATSTVPQMLLDTLRAAAPPHVDGEPRSRCCPPDGRTPPGSSTPSWPRRWASRWCGRRTCRCATESCCATSVPRPARRCPVCADGRGHAAVVHRL